MPMRQIGETTLSLGSMVGGVEVKRVYMKAPRRARAVCTCGHPCTTKILCDHCGRAYDSYDDVALRGVDAKGGLITFEKAELDLIRSEFEHDSLRIEAIVSLSEVAKRFGISDYYYILPRDRKAPFAQTYGSLAAALHQEGWLMLTRYTIGGENQRWVIASDGRLLVGHKLIELQEADYVPAHVDQRQVDHAKAVLKTLLRNDFDFPPEQDPVLLLLERKKADGEVLP